MRATENRYGKIGRCLCVHLNGHESQHFVFDKQTYIYASSTPLGEEEFKKECETRGWTCIFRKGSAYIQTEDVHFFISEKGTVFRDGALYTISVYIEEQEGHRTVPVYNPEKILSLDYVQAELLRMDTTFKGMSNKIEEMMRVCKQYHAQPKIIPCKGCRHYSAKAGICKHPTNGLKHPHSGAWCCYADNDTVV